MLFNNLSDKKVRPNLSKSLYIRGLQCYKSLWLKKHKPELRTPITPAKLALFDKGRSVGILAHKLYSGGKNIDDHATSFGHRFKLTEEYIKKDCKTIYEATFQYNNITIMADILHKTKAGWELTEVKSSTGVKDIHIPDLAIQYYILINCGIKISKVQVAHINTSYKKGWTLNIKKLFSIIDVTNKVIEYLPQIAKHLPSMRETIKNCQQPNIKIGPQCFNPYECEFKDYCWNNVPENPIFEISGMPKKKKFQLYNQNITKIENIPKDYPLTANQKIQYEVLTTKKDHIETQKIKDFIDKLSYPLYFLDFETLQFPIPTYRNTNPYQQTPFQYSLHWLENKSDTLNHHAFLAEEGKDPRRTISKSLIKHIPENACILAYNAGFEKSIIRSLAVEFPIYRKKLLRLTKNVFDLSIPFEKHHIYTKEMHGSHSIKKVLPALVPKIHYSDLNISDGESAARIYEILHLQKDIEKKNQIRENLLEYCKLDTYAMVKILEKLQELIK